MKERASKEVALKKVGIKSYTASKQGIIEYLNSIGKHLICII